MPAGASDLSEVLALVEVAFAPPEQLARLLSVDVEILEPAGRGLLECQGGAPRFAPLRTPYYASPIVEVRDANLVAINLRADAEVLETALLDDRERVRLRAEVAEANLTEVERRRCLDAIRTRSAVEPRIAQEAAWWFH